MAYVALTNLTNTIRCLNSFSRLSDLPYSFDTIDFPYDDIEFFKKAIQKLDERSRNVRVKAFYEKIREAAHGLEDAIESVLSDLILIAQSEQSIGNECPWVHEEKVKEGLNSFVETAKKIKEEYSNELEYSLPDEEEDDNDDDDDFGRKKQKMVGSNCKDLITKIKDQVRSDYESSELRVVSIVGVAGSGRTTFAWRFFHNKSAPSLHKLRALVRVGPKYEFKDILLSILSQIDTNDHKLLCFEGEEKIFEYLHSILKGGDYLIVLDDVQETRVWEYLRKLFPNENNGSRVLLTTHLQEVAVFAQSFRIHPMPVLHSEESWKVISGVLFPNKQSCPPELEKAGKKIAKNCEGLLFEVGRYADILSKVDRTPEHWNNIAAEMVINTVSYDEMSEISKLMGVDYSILRPCNLPQIMVKTLNLPNALYNIWKDVYILPTYVAVVGMAGIGKTAIVREVFNDPWTLSSYNHRLWLTIGPKYQFKRLLVDILHQLVGKMHTELDDETLVKHIRSILSAGKRCFMVLDDVWDKDPRPYLGKLLQVIKFEVLLTTRLSGVAMKYFDKSNRDRVHEMQLLNDEESWSLLREGVFGEELCPRELEKPGKLIVENCEGLPLTIVTVASLISKADENTLEYWNNVAENKNSVFEQAYRKISKVLYPSYKNLDLEFRACFLYMAAFYLKYKIRISKLFMLYNVEGIIPSGSWNLENHYHYLNDLYGKSLILTKFSADKKNTCRLHSVFWHFCVREARNEKFFHVLNCIGDGLADDILNQRRLCVQNSVLFAIKDVYDSMASVSAARSLLCFGPPHPYQVPMCLELKFLNVLDALSIRFYEFPVGIFKLVLLRYLALTYNGELHASIAKLWSLEFLIIHQNMSIRFPGNLMYLPVEIWEMKELKHLEIMGSNLPEPPSSSTAILDKLSSLILLRSETVTKSILERIPNLKQLGFRIELAPDHTFESLFSFDPIFHLKRLEFLQCVIENPKLNSVVLATPAPFSMLPSSLTVLILGGFGCPWEHITPIALLPNLRELELKCYAFQGSEWVMHEGDFKSLCFLKLEDTDLVDWRADDFCHLISLKHLYIRHGHKLKKIPWHSLPRSCRKTLVDCNPSASEKMPENDCQIICSWLQGGKI